MPPYRPLDFCALEEQLGDDERAIRDAVRAWISERFLPLVPGHFDAGTFPMELAPELGRLGVFGSNLPGEASGGGLSEVAYGLICRELERGDSGLRSFVSVQSSLVMWPIHTYGSDEQRQEWLPRLASGEAVGCFGLTEPGFGSNPGGMRTVARRDGEDWVLDGHKLWITNGSVADVALVWARVDDTFRGFLVPAGTPGFSAPEQRRKWSLRASITSELVLECVRLPASAMLPGVRGLKGPLSCLNQARYGIAWGATGAMAAVLDEGLRYAGEREVFERPLAGYQLPQQKLADVATELTLAQLLALRLGRLKEAGELTPAQVSMAKRNNVMKALEAARTVRDLLGANGVSLEYQVGRHLCNLESVVTYEGTHDIHALAIGQELTGLSAFR